MSQQVRDEPFVTEVTSFHPKIHMSLHLKTYEQYILDEYMKKYAESMGHMTFRRYMDICHFRYCRNRKEWIKDETKASENRTPTEWKPVKRLESFQNNLMVLYQEYLDRKGFSWLSSSLKFW